MTCNVWSATLNLAKSFIRLCFHGLVASHLPEHLSRSAVQSIQSVCPCHSALLLLELDTVEGLGLGLKAIQLCPWPRILWP